MMLLVLNHALKELERILDAVPAHRVHDLPFGSIATSVKNSSNVSERVIVIKDRLIIGAVLKTESALVLLRFEKFRASRLHVLALQLQDR